MLEDEAHTTQTMLFNGRVAGSVSSAVDEEEHVEVTSWIGKPSWGQGMVTGALSAFLEHHKVRPLSARAAADHAASLRVWEQGELVRIGTTRDVAKARGREERRRNGHVCFVLFSCSVHTGCSELNALAASAHVTSASNG